MSEQLTLALFDTTPLYDDRNHYPTFVGWGVRIAAAILVLGTFKAIADQVVPDETLRRRGEEEDERKAIVQWVVRSEVERAVRAELERLASADRDDQGDDAGTRG